MATETNGIATYLEAKNKGLAPIAGVQDNNKCVTRAVVEEMGGTVSGIYAMNQLVKYSDIIVKLYYYITVTPRESADFQYIILMEVGSVPDAGISYEEITYNNYSGAMHPFERGNPLRINTEQGGTDYIYSGTQYLIYARYTGGSYTYLTSVYHTDSDYTVYL